MVSVGFTIGRGPMVDPGARDREERIRRQAQVEAITKNLKDTTVTAENELTTLLTGLAKERDAQGNFVWGSLEEIRERNPQLAQLIDRGAATVARNKSRFAEITGAEQLGSRPLDEFERFRQVFNIARSGAMQTETPAAQSPIGKLQADKEALLARGMQPNDPTILAIDAAIDKAGENETALAQNVGFVESKLERRLTEVELLAMSNAIQAGFSVEVMPDGTMKVVSGIQPQGGTSDVERERSFLQNNIDAVRQVLDLPPGRLGAAGLLKRVASEAGEIGGDVLSTFLPDPIVEPFLQIGRFAEDLAGRDTDLTPEQRAEFFDDPINTVAGLSGRLTYAYAKTLQKEGKLLKDAVNDARDVANLQSAFRSEDRTRTNLNLMLDAFEDNYAAITPGGSPRVREPSGQDRIFEFDPTTGTIPGLTDQPLETEAGPEPTTDVEVGPLTPGDQSLVPQANPPIPGPAAAAGQGPINAKDVQADIANLQQIKAQSGRGPEFIAALNAIIQKYGGEGRALEAIVDLLGQ